jgi:opacity protein-like surface antigen
MVLGVLAVAGTLASPAFAADGFSGFRLQMTLADEQLEGTYMDDFLGGESINTGRFGYGLGGGWSLNKYLAFEANLRGGTSFNQDGFADFRDAIEVLPPPVAPPGTTPPNQPAFFKIRNNVKGLDASVVGSFWIGNRFSIFGRAGLYAWRAETTYSWGDYDAASPNRFEDSADDEGFSPLFGVGLQTVLDGALVRVEYQRTDVGDLTHGVDFSQRDNIISSLNFSIVWTIQ